MQQHVREWPIKLYFFEEEGRTQARVSLKADARTLEAVGEARCAPWDFDIPEIGDEVAAGRALVWATGCSIPGRGTSRIWKGIRPSSALRIRSPFPFVVRHLRLGDGER